MKRSLVLMAAVCGLGTAAVPFALSWSLSLAVVAGNVIPGLLTAVLGGFGGWLPVGEEGEEAELLLEKLCSLLVVFGSWTMLSPFLLGFPLGPGVYLGTVVPGAVILGLALLNGYQGWRQYAE